jgi:hypothetical protein
MCLCLHLCDAPACMRVCLFLCVFTDARSQESFCKILRAAKWLGGTQWSCASAYATQIPFTITTDNNDPLNKPVLILLNFLIQTMQIVVATHLTDSHFMTDVPYLTYHAISSKSHDF